MKIFTTIQAVKYNFQQRIVLPAIAFFFMMSMSAVSMAQDLAKFKECANSSVKGVASIPFPSERAAAQNAEDLKTDLEKEAILKFGVKELTDKLAAAKKKLADEQRKLQTAEKDLADAKKYHPTIISKEEDAFEASTKEVKKLESEISEIYEEIEYGANHWKQVGLARGKVRVAFNNALAELNNAESDPEEYIGDKPSNADVLKKWNADLALLKGYITQIRTKMESSAATHDQAEDDAQRAAQNLMNL